MFVHTVSNLLYIKKHLSKSLPPSTTLAEPHFFNGSVGAFVAKAGFLPGFKGLGTCLLKQISSFQFVQDDSSDFLVLGCPLPWDLHNKF